MVRRSRPGAGAAVVLLLLQPGSTPTLSPGALAAQTLGGAHSPGVGAWGGPMLEPGHWSLSLLELLDAAGVPGAWTGSVGLPYASAVHMALAGGSGAHGAEAGAVLTMPAPLLSSWRRSLQEEFPVRNAPPRTNLPRGPLSRSSTEPPPAPAALRLEGGYRDRSPEPGRLESGWLGSAALEIRPGEGTRGWVEWGGGSGHPGADLHRWGVALNAGPVVVAALRHPLKLGPGATDPLLSGGAVLDALHIRSEHPMEVPWLGAVAFAGSLSRLPRVGEVESPWYGTVTATTAPSRWLRLGGSRTAVFSGEGRPQVSGPRIWSLLVGRHSTDVGEFEDQHASLFLELLPTVLGRTFRLHGVLAVNDTEGSLRDDPAAVAGVTIPILHSSGLWGLRYEYGAFGPRARLCPGCRLERSRGWYNHYVYGDHTVAGVPLGSPLGGYGASHSLSSEWWAPEGGLHVRLRAFQERREEGNLFQEEWFGVWNGAEAEALLFMEGGARLQLLGGGVAGPDGARRWGGSAGVHLTLGVRP